MAAALSASPQESSDQAVRRLFTSKLELNRYLNPYSFRGAIARAALSADIPAAGLAADAGDGSDPMEELGKLFKPLTLTLDAKNVASLVGTGIEDFLEAISGAKPISEVLNDMFNIFKLDEAMKTLGSILSGGQISTLVAKIPLKEYLSNPIDNAFFAGLYKHYFPDKTFNALDFTAFMGALFGYVAFAAQGKSDAFHSVFSDQQSLSELTSTPSKWVQAISGAATPAPVAMSAAPAEGLELRAAPPQPPRPSAGDPPSWVGPVAIVSAGLMTLLVGAFGAVSFGTGLIASPMTAGVAAGGFQALGGIAQNGDTRDVKWDLLGGFVGGFTGAFLATVFGNKLFAGWAQRGDTPTARIQKLRLIMAGFTLTLGGGGGAIISSLLKNYAKSQKLVFDDALALTCGAVGGLGGGAMGCGLHFMGGISGSSCLPVALSLQEANQIQLSAITPAAPVMNNAAPMPAQNAAFPPPLAANPNVAMGVYKNEFNQPGVLPANGKSIAFVKWSEFTLMDQGDPTPPPTPGYNGQRQKLFWLEAGAGGAGVAPAANRRADLVIGVHGVGRYVFPCITHENPAGGDNVDFTRPMFETDFVSFLAADPWITGFLGGLGRRGIIKLAVCFSALPLGICSLSQELATRLNATVYGGRPPVVPWLDTTGRPQVPWFGGWVQYDP
jgi:hypothetical protein